MAGDVDYSSVALLLHGDGTNGSTTFTDNSPTPKTLSLTGTVEVSTTQSKYGGASLKFTGSASNIYIANQPDLRLNSGDFTIEFEARPDGVSTLQCVIGQRNPSSGFGWQLFFAANGSFYIQCSSGSPNYVQTSAGVLTASTWQHVAITRQGSTLRLFLNGVLLTTNTTAVISSETGAVFAIGGRPTGSPVYPYLGYLDEVRITSGVARYTATFTPPASAHPNYTVQVSGTVVDSAGSPASRTIRAYRRDTGVLLGETTSTSGSYTLNLPYTGEVNVICLDDVAGTTENDLILRTTAS